MRNSHKSYSPRSVLVIGFILCLASLPTAMFGQDETIRVDTDLVTIPVTVLHRQGRYFPGLSAEQFRVLEDGIDQKIELFETNELEITVFLLLDRSGSMGLYKGEMANAASILVRKLRRDDSLIAASFANEVDVLIPLTKVADVKKGIKIREIRGDNNTMLFDAMDFALRKMKKVKGRKAIILFSDGGGTPRYSTAKGNLTDAEEQETLIYTIQFNTFSGPLSGPNRKAVIEAVADANSYMRMLPAKTGGRYFSIESITDLDKTFASVIDELSSQYTLGYYPSKEGRDGERRRITVKVNLPNVAVRSRNEVVYKKP